MADPVRAKYLARLEGLIQKGNAVLATANQPPRQTYRRGVVGVPSISSVNASSFYEWRTQSLNFLTDLLGANHVYTRNFDEKCQNTYPGESGAGMAILRAVNEDLENGDLSNLTELVHADTFADFLEMADYLLAEGGYKDAAAVLAGGVLESHLRLLCHKNRIPIEVATNTGSRLKKADVMNADLARASMYSKLDQKSITAWLDLRNSAAHGNYGAYDKEQVAQLIQGVRSFAARTPA